MKKVLALVLAVAMMATVAFAATDLGRLDPGSEDIDLAAGMSAVEKLNTDNYSIKKVSYDSGKAYVSSIVLDDDEGDALELNIKSDYTMVYSEEAKCKDLEFTVELRGKGSKIDDVKASYVAKVGYVQNKVEIDDESEIDENTLSFVTVNKFASEKDANDKVIGMPYGTLEFDTDDSDTTVSVRVYDGDKAYLGYNYDADKKVLIANADADAEVSFLNFEAKPSFNSTATVYFYQVDEDGFVYELTGEGKIKKSAAKWSDDDGAWILKTRTLGSYVFSDKALASAAAADDTTTNPDTGANDVVGIATALAVVSLVAAGAVSLKK